MDFLHKRTRLRKMDLRFGIEKWILERQDGVVWTGLI
jgi:hypothetical protein